MNKLFTKIAALALGATMAVGVGVAVASRVEASPVHADAATMTGVTQASDATVNGKTAIKCGTSSKAGAMKVTVPASSTALNLYIAGWNGDSSSVSIKISNGSISPSTNLSLTSDTGIANNSPFTLASTESTYYKEFTLENVTAASDITFTATKASKCRFVVWGATYESSGGSFGTLDHIKITTPASSSDFKVGQKFSSAGLVLTGYDSATEATAHTQIYSSGFTTDFDGHLFVPSDKGTNKTVTVTYSTKTTTYTINVTGGDVCLHYDNSPFGSATSASSTAATVTLDGVQYENKYGYNYSTDTSIEFGKNTDAYLGNKASYQVSTVNKNISKIEINWQKYNNSSEIDVYDCSNALNTSSGATELTATDSNLVSTYTFSDENQYFMIRVNSTSHYINLMSIVVYLGSTHVVYEVDTVSASIKSGTYYTGSTLSASDFNVTVTWTGGKADTNPTSGFTWTVGGVENGTLSEGSNTVVVTYEGVDSDPFTVTGTTVHATSISIDETASVYVGETVTINATVTPEGYVDTIEWESDDEDVATVDSDGVVTGVASGTATITATVNGHDDTCTVTVSIAPSKATWDLTTKTYTVTGETGSKVVTWTNSYATMINRDGASGTAADNYLGGDANNRTSSRFYSGNLFSLTPETGVEISSVVFTATSNSYASAFAGTTFTNASASAVESVVTLTPTNGKNAISCTVGGTCGFTAVDVYYTAKVLTSITWDGVPVTPQYVGDIFDYSGLTFTAHYSDGSTDPILGSAFTWSPLVAGQNPIGSFGGQNVSISGVSVINNILESITISGSLTKTEYKVGSAWSPAGLTVTGTYSKGDTDVTSSVSWSYSPTAPAADTESVTVTATLGGKTDSKSFDITIVDYDGPVSNGRYYIMNSTKTLGLTAARHTTTPLATDLAEENALVAWDLAKVADNLYSITTTVSSTTYMLVDNTTADKSSNAMIRALDANDSNLAALDSYNWTIETTTGGYYLSQNTKGSTIRYLSQATGQSGDDWRGYLNKDNGDPVISLVPEGSLADSIVSQLNANGLCDNGNTAPSTSTWSTIASTTHISYELGLVAAAEYTKTGSGTETVVTAKAGTTQAYAEAAARYDYIVGKYNKGQGLTAYNDFLGRDPDPIGVGRVNPLVESLGNSTNAVTIVVIVSVISLTAIGGYIFLRRRKEQ